MQDDWRPLVQLDYRILPLLVSICPNEELPNILHLLPTNLSAAWLHQMIKDHHKWSVNEVIVQFIPL